MESSKGFFRGSVGTLTGRCWQRPAHETASFGMIGRRNLDIQCHLLPPEVRYLGPKNIPRWWQLKHFLFLPLPAGNDPI